MLPSQFRVDSRFNAEDCATLFAVTLTNALTLCEAFDRSLNSDDASEASIESCSPSELFALTVKRWRVGVDDARDFMAAKGLKHWGENAALVSQARQLTEINDACAKRLMSAMRHAPRDRDALLSALKTYLKSTRRLKRNLSPRRVL